MNKRMTVKVVKRDARRQQETAAAVEQNVAQKKTTQDAARDMVATVTGWVSEFQQKRRHETSRALKTLFPEASPQAGKA